MQEQNHTTSQWLFPKIFAVIIAVFVVGFGVQTYFLVDALMPADQMLMKCLTVFAFDGCALIYFVAKGYYPFRSEQSLHAVKVMFRVTFAGSAACTVIWMILNADHFNWSLVPGPLVFSAYVLVTFAVTINVLVFYYIWEQENAAKHPKPKPATPNHPEHASPSHAAPSLNIQEIVQNALTQALAAQQQQQALPAPQGPTTQPLANSQAYLDLLDKAVRYGQITQEEAQPLRDMLSGGAAASPLSQAPTPSKGQLNGRQ